MNLTPIDMETLSLPDKITAFINGCGIYNSSCSDKATTIYIDRDTGFFLKISEKNSLAGEAEMSAYLNTKGLAPKVIDYYSDDRDYLITEKIHGLDGTTRCFIERPRKLCDKLAKALRTLHETDFSDCTKNVLGADIERAEKGIAEGAFDKHCADYLNLESFDEAKDTFEKVKGTLKADTLIHGDYCLPNVLFRNFELSGFIDLGAAGISDRHIDIYWGTWTLMFNLKTDAYKDRFIDAYGRDLFDKDRYTAAGLLSVFQ